MVKCKRPFVRGTLPFGCGVCMPCRIAARRVWQHRILLESYCHSDSAFITLTYDDEHLPGGYCDIESRQIWSTLSPADLRNFFKRLRIKLGSGSIRYFAVGEYGERTWRPHYHIGLFGFPACFGNTRRKACPCASCKIIRETWGKGHVVVGTLTKDSAAYIAGYVTKKLTQADNDKNREWRTKNNQLLGSRHPEFARHSRNPGLGALYVPRLASSMDNERGMVSIDRDLDVPSILVNENKKRPLGRYLKEKLREALQFPEKGCPEIKLKRWSEEMSAVLKENLGPTYSTSTAARRSLVFVDLNKDSSDSYVRRFNLFNKKGVL